MTGKASMMLPAIGKRARLTIALVAACAPLVGMLVTTTAPASASTSTPAHHYTASCWGPYDFGSGPFDVITAFPDSLETQPGVGTSDINGDGTVSPDYDQYVYYWLWVYSSKGWLHSAAKRFHDLYINGVEAWDTQAGGWLDALDGNYLLGSVVDTTIASPDLTIPARDVGLRVPAGNRTWWITVETYWAPPFASGYGPAWTDPTIPSGGLNNYDQIVQVSCP